MPITYNKLFLLLKEKGITSYRIRQDKLLGQATLQKLRSGDGIIDTRTIAKLCELLECQPGEIMEYTSSPYDAKGVHSSTRAAIRKELIKPFEKQNNYQLNDND